MSSATWASTHQHATWCKHVIFHTPNMTICHLLIPPGPGLPLWPHFNTSVCQAGAATFTAGSTNLSRLADGHGTDPSLNPKVDPLSMRSLAGYVQGAAKLDDSLCDGASYCAYSNQALGAEVSRSSTMYECFEVACPLGGVIS